VSALDTYLAQVGRRGDLGPETGDVDLRGPVEGPKGFKRTARDSTPALLVQARRGARLAEVHHAALQPEYAVIRDAEGGPILHADGLGGRGSRQEKTESDD
jgi:hypothetical protein